MNVSRFVIWTTPYSATQVADLLRGPAVKALGVDDEINAIAVVPAKPISGSTFEALDAACEEFVASLLGDAIDRVECVVPSRKAISF